MPSLDRVGPPWMGRSDKSSTPEVLDRFAIRRHKPVLVGERDSRLVCDADHSRMVASEDEKASWEDIGFLTIAKYRAHLEQESLPDDDCGCCIVC